MKMIFLGIWWLILSLFGTVMVVIDMLHGGAETVGEIILGIFIISVLLTTGVLILLTGISTRHEKNKVTPTRPSLK
jgi:hypothetical protein